MWSMRISQFRCLKLMAKRIRYGTCQICDSVLKKDEVALSIKLFGKDSSKFCLTCISHQLDVTVEDLKERIEEYKSEGCELFQ